MLRVRVLLLLGLLLRALPGAAQEPVPADAYRDGGARELVRLARARRATVDTRITAYQATARERLSARVGTAGFDRLLLRRETVSRVEWTRDTVRIQLLGAREAQPLVARGAQLPPADIAGSMPSLAFDPVDSEMLLRVDSTFIRHPLAPGSESYYRYASGDSASIRLPDGRVVRLLELRISARRPDPRLINGSFWLDAATHAVVRAVVRLSRPMSATRSGLSLFLPEVTGDLDHVAIEYGLLDLRWWLPRVVVVRGVGRVAGLRFTMEYERRYEGYRVVGDTLSPVPPAAAALVRAETRPCRPRTYGSITIGPALGDSAWGAAFQHAAARAGAADSARASGGNRGRAAADTLAGASRPPCDRAFIVTRAQGVDLLHSPSFGSDVYDEGERGPDAADLRALSEAVKQIPLSPWILAPPRLQLLAADMIRFDRVEGLSLGARGILPLGPAEARGELRAGTTGEIGLRLSGVFTGPSFRTEIAAYRGLQALEVASQPFSLASSASALLLGRDENDYYRASGGELRLGLSPSRPQRWELRLFAERQEPVRARSGASLRGLFDDGFEVRPNLAADRLSQAGATLRLRAAHGDDPGRPRTRAELVLHGETGSRSFARPFLRLGTDAAFGRGIGLALSLAAGSALGDVPAQGTWQIGGSGTVRGQDPAALRGRVLWLGRTELSFGPPAMRMAAFGDAGWAGDRSALASARPLGGAGIGISLLGNLLRLDLARGIRGGGSRAYVRMGGAL